MTAAEIHRVSFLRVFFSLGKSALLHRNVKIIQAPSLLETFLNIKKQFEIDVDATCITLKSKNILLFVFQFLEKMFFNTMYGINVVISFDGCFSFKMEDCLFI